MNHVSSSWYIHKSHILGVPNAILIILICHNFVNCIGELLCATYTCPIYTFDIYYWLQQPKCWKAFHCLLLNQFRMGPHEDQILFNIHRAVLGWLGCGLLWFECRLWFLFAFKQVNDNEIGSQVSNTVEWEINPMKLNWLFDKTIYDNFWIIEGRLLWALEGAVQETWTQ